MTGPAETGQLRNGDSAPNQDVCVASEGVRGAGQPRPRSVCPGSTRAKGFPDTGKSLWSMRTRPEVREPKADFAALAFAPNRWIDAEGVQLKGFVCEWEQQP